MNTILNYGTFLNEAMQIQGVPPELQEAISVAESSGSANPSFIEFLKGPGALRFSSDPFKLVSTNSQIKNGTFVFTSPNSDNAIAMYKQGYVRVVPYGRNGQARVLINPEELITLINPEAEINQDFNTIPLESGEKYVRWNDNIDEVVYDYMTKFLDMKLDTSVTGRNFPGLIRMKGTSSVKKKANEALKAKINVFNSNNEKIATIPGSIVNSSKWKAPFVNIEETSITNFESSVWSPDVFDALIMRVYTRTGSDALLMNNSSFGAKEEISMNMYSLTNLSNCEFFTESPKGKIDLNLTKQFYVKGKFDMSDSKISSTYVKLSLHSIIAKNLQISCKSLSLFLRDEFDISGIKIDGKLKSLELTDVSNKLLGDTLFTISDKLSECPDVKFYSCEFSNEKIQLQNCINLTINNAPEVVFEVNPEKIRTLFMSGIKLKNSPALQKAVIKMLSNGPNSQLFTRNFRNEGLKNYSIVNCDFTGVDLSSLKFNENGIRWTRETFETFIEQNNGIKLEENSESPLIRMLAKAQHGREMFGL
jgi:hypothetical protein